MLNYLKTKTWIALLTLIIGIIAIVSWLVSMIISNTNWIYSFSPGYMILWIASIFTNVKLLKYNKQSDKLYEIPEHLLIIGCIFAFINYFIYKSILTKLNTNHAKYIDLKLITKHKFTGLILGFLLLQTISYTFIMMTPSINSQSLLLVIYVLIIVFSFLCGLVCFIYLISTILGNKTLRKSNLYCTELLTLSFLHPIGIIWLMIMFLKWGEFRQPNLMSNHQQA